MTLELKQSKKTTKVGDKKQNANIPIVKGSFYIIIHNGSILMY